MEAVILINQYVFEHMKRYFFILIYFVVLLLYMVYDANADTGKLILIPFIVSFLLSVIVAILRKPVKRFYKNKYDKQYIYNKQADRDKIKKRAEKTADSN